MKFTTFAFLALVIIYRTQMYFLTRTISLMYSTHTDYILQLGQDHVYIYNAKYVTSKHENTQPLPLPWEMRERGRLCSLSLSCNTCWCVRTWWCYHCYQTVECACRCRECRECQVTRIIYTDYIGYIATTAVVSHVFHNNRTDVSTFVLRETILFLNYAL